MIFVCTDVFASSTSLSVICLVEALLQVNLMRLLNLACGHFEAYSVQHHKKLVSRVSFLFSSSSRCVLTAALPFTEQFRSASGAVRVEVPSEEDGGIPTGEATPTGAVDVEDFVAEVDATKVRIILLVRASLLHCPGGSNYPYVPGGVSLV
jgi:hypothetical protein